MKYSYTALSTDNQKLTGILDAESIEAAQEELHRMGLSIISINEISEEESETQKTVKAAEKAEGIQTFVFEAFDRRGKEINGTIDAADDYSAYKRLITEYKFKVNSMYLTGASDAEKAEGKEKIAEFNTRMEEEGVYVSTEEEMEKADFDEAAEKIDKKITEEIDHFIINVKKILDEYSAGFSPPFLRQIENTLGELERVRTSTNLKHISEVCNQLYELISNPDQPETAEGSAGTNYQNILNLMKGTSLIRGDFDIHAKVAGFNKIQTLFKKIIKKLTGSELIAQKKETAAVKLLNKLLTKKVKPKVLKAKPKTPEKPGFTNTIKKIFSYLTAPNAILRKTRKQELLRAYMEWRKPKIKEKPVPVKKPAIKPAEELLPKSEKPSRWDFTGFFTETDSFISWLLFFYILFFFLVDFSLEKDMGLPRDFVVKTLKTPLILNITIFLLFAHLIFKLKTQYFRHNLIGSLFLIFFGFGIYALVVINF
jgi:hypothetical protein